MDLASLTTDTQVLMGDIAVGSSKHEASAYTSALNWAQTQIGQLLGLTYLEAVETTTRILQPNGTMVTEVAIPGDAAKVDRVMQTDAALPVLVYFPYLFLQSPFFNIWVLPETTANWINPFNMSVTSGQGTDDIAFSVPSGLPNYSTISIQAVLTSGPYVGTVLLAYFTLWDLTDAGAFITFFSGSGTPGSTDNTAYANVNAPWITGTGGGYAMNWTCSGNATITSGVNDQTCTFTISASANPGDTVTLTMTYDTTWQDPAGYSQNFTVI